MLMGMSDIDIACPMQCTESSGSVPSGPSGPEHVFGDHLDRLTRPSPKHIVEHCCHACVYHCASISKSAAELSSTQATGQATPGSGQCPESVPGQCGGWKHAPESLSP